MGCVSSKSKHPDREPPYGVPVTSSGTEKSGSRDGSKSAESDVGYDHGVTREKVKVSRDSGDAQVRSKTSTSSYERRRPAQQTTSDVADDVTDQPPSHAVVSACLYIAINDSCFLIVLPGTDIKERL